jgi:hypothetical protein
MNVQLRNGNGYPSRGSMPPPRMFRGRNLGRMGQSNINPTTIWTPATGFLNQPGTLTQGYQYQPQVTSVYDVPGLLLPALDCTQANGGAFVSSACVDQNDAIQQENFARTAAYNAGTLKLPAATPPVTTPITTPATTTPASTPKATPPQQGGTTAASTNAGGGSTSSSSGSSSSSTSTVNPALYWIAGLAAVALLIAAVK